MPVITCLFFLLLQIPTMAHATAAFNGVFGSNMVLQRSKPVHIWGTAAVGENVTVTFAGQNVTSTADSNGNWSLCLAAMAANATGQNLKVQGSANTVTFSNVVVGDIWFCSGQSNMAYQLDDPIQWGQQIWPAAAFPNGPTDATTANLPNLRVLYVPIGNEVGGQFVYNTPATPQTQPPPTADLQSGWSASVSGWNACVAANNPAIIDYSATGFYFGRAVSQDLGIPVGIISDAIGGTPAEAFVSAQALEAEPSLSAVIPYINGGAAAKTAAGVTTNQWPTGEFNGSINPFTPMTIKGFLWDQGEANTASAANEGNGIDSTQYNTLFTVLIKDWRARWGENLPFIYVQLQQMSVLASSPPPVNIAYANNCDATQDVTPGQAGCEWGDVREGQFQALGLSNTGMSVNIDDNMNALYFDAASTTETTLTIYHSPNKQYWAGRLTPIAEAEVYGIAQPHGIYNGPHYQTYQVQGSSIQVTFDSPLGTTDGASARGFIIGDGSNWAWADTVILSGNIATISSALITSPTTVKYAWSMNPTDPTCNPGYTANLSDPTGTWLASPFTTCNLPVMNVQGNGISIMDNNLSPTVADGTNFGTVDVVNVVNQTFTIQNLGATTLNLTGGSGNLVRIAGVNASDFLITVAPASSVAPGSSTTFTVSFQPGSLGLQNGVLEIPSNDPIRTPYYIFLTGNGTNGITPSATPNWTHTVSPTMTPSFTSTPSSTVTPACTGGLIDNLDDGNTENNYGGYWYVYAGAGTSVINPSPFTPTAPGYGGTGYCALVSGSADETDGPPSLGTGLAASGTNASAYSGISFEFKGDGNKYEFMIHSLVEGVCGGGGNCNDYEYTFTPPVGWSLVTIPWSSFVFPGWGPVYSEDTTELTGMSWVPLNNGSFAFSVDNVEFTCPAQNSPTPTPSSSATRTATPSLTWTESVTVTTTFTVFTTSTPSPTLSTSFTTSPTPTVSATLTSSPTVSTSFTPSPTLTTSATATLSSTASPSATPSPTVTASETVSPSSTATASFTPSPSSSPTPTASSSSTMTPSSTVSPTATPSLSPSPIFTHSETATPTPSFTKTPIKPPVSPNGSGGTVISCLPALNPQSGSSYRFAVQLSAPSTGLSLRIYSRAMMAIEETDVSGSWHAGWNTVSVTVPGLANGLYFVLVRAVNEPSFGHRPALLMIIN